MPIKISVTYEIVTEESAEDGEVADSGFEFENADYGFRELVDYIQSEGFTNPSSSHGVPRWITTEVIQDRAFFEDGEHRTLSIHPGKDARSQKYWAKACKAAGVIKG
jgi:hypothetical protein